jgi:putative oxidoreductase
MTGVRMSGAGSRSVIEETGDSGWELRMLAKHDYTHGGAWTRQYHPRAPGLIAQGSSAATGVRVNLLIRWLIDWPRRVAGHLAWLAPLFARITVGWVFLLSGWGKLMNLPQVTENFVGWGIPLPHLLAPFTSAVELFGGLFLLLGLLTRLSAGALGVTMIVAIKSAKWADVDSLETLLGFDETEYLALFLWLAIAGAGAVSIDHWLQRRFSRDNGRPG